ncbi:MAG: hypothetical protein R3C19_08825 [Planctomycetaceae bacterium]
MNTRTTVCCVAMCVVLCDGRFPARGQDVLQPSVPHEHAALVVRSRPVIERLPLRVITPKDVVSSGSGRVYVADNGGKAVFRVASDGQIALLAGDLEGLVRISVAATGDVFALLNSQGSGRIMHITPAGHVSEIAQTAFPASGLASDRAGSLLTTNTRTGDVIAIDAEGTTRVLARLTQPASDLVLDALDNPIVLLKAGKVVSVGAEGNSQVIGYVPRFSDRLQLHPDGFVVALGTSDEDSRSSLWRLTADPAEEDRFAALPDGTSAFAFDGLGNLVLANPNLRAVTRVTSRFQIPCPHCAEPVTMIFSTVATPEFSEPRRSY